jgi:hypothetical protein
VARILWRDAQGIEGSIDLGSTEIKIGRAMDCAIRTDDAMVSRHHARMFWGGGGYVLEDLGSANGVYYQEQRVQSHLLKHGDAVRCGSLWLRFVEAAGASAPAPAAAPVAAPMMQHPGAGSVGQHGPTSHVASQGAPLSASIAAQLVEPIQAPPSSSALGEAEAEVRQLRRRLEQLQTELRVFRQNKFSVEHARKLEDLENDLAMVEIERDQLKQRMKFLEDTLSREAGSIKVKRALEIAQRSAETSASLVDLLSSIRIEVMAAEAEFEQYAHALPRSSFEMIRQSLREASANSDKARELLKALREVSE